jgi:hypothetical protein
MQIALSYAENPKLGENANRSYPTQKTESSKNWLEASLKAHYLKKSLSNRDPKTSKPER